MEDVAEDAVNDSGRTPFGVSGDRHGRLDAPRAIGDLDPCLITGATGEIGSHCVRLLNAGGVIPAALLRRPLPPGAWREARVTEVAGDLEAVARGEVPPVAGDLEAVARGEVPPELNDALSRAGTILHLAARVNLRGRGGEEMKRINERATIELFARAQKAGVRRFVHVSTIGTVGCSATPTPLDEEAEYNLAEFDNPYFDTKRRAEQALLDLWKHAPAATDLVIVNPSINIGRQGSFRRLARKKQRRTPPKPGSLVYKLICFWFKGGINLVDVRDVAQGILLAACKGTAGQRYILAGDNLTIRELMTHLQRVFGTGGPRLRLPLGMIRTTAAMMETWASATGKRAPLNRAVARLGGPFWFYDSSRAKNELGYSPRPIEETLRDLRAWVEELRQKT
jgi:dihydroflavonol-4-reductase